MPVTLTDEQAAALTRVMGRHERHHFDGVCTSNGLQDDCEACGDIAVVRDALTRAPAPCPHRELLRELREHASDTLCEKCEECGSSELRRRIDAALASTQSCSAPGEAGSPPMPWGEMAYWLGKSLEVYSGNDVLAEPAQQIIDWMQAEARRRAPGEAGDGWELEYEGPLIEYPAALSILGRDTRRVYRRRAPEREGDAR